MSKILYFDVETTGLDPVQHDIIQLDGIIAAHIDGKTKEDLRKRTIKDFEQGKIQVLYNVGVFDERFWI